MSEKDKVQWMTDGPPGTSVNKGLFLRERLLLEATEALARAREDSRHRLRGDQNRAIRRILQGPDDLQLRHLSDALWWCGYHAEIKLVPLDEGVCGGVWRKV